MSMICSWPRYAYYPRYRLHELWRSFPRASWVAPNISRYIFCIYCSFIFVRLKIFALYPDHRQSILNDLFSSITRLAGSTRTRRGASAASESQLHILSELLLQFVQCISFLSPSTSSFGELFSYSHCLYSSPDVLFISTINFINLYSSFYCFFP